MGVIHTPPITLNHFWRGHMRNLQANDTFCSSPSQERSAPLLHQTILRDLIGVIYYTSATPENSGEFIV